MLALLFRVCDGLYQFGINGHADLVAHDPLIASHAKVSPVHGPRSGHTHMQPSLLVLDRLRGAVDVKRDRLRDTADGQVPSDLQFVRPAGLNLRGSKRQSRILLNIKEVIAAQVVIAHLDAGIHGSNVNPGKRLFNSLLRKADSRLRLEILECSRASASARAPSRFSIASTIARCCSAAIKAVLCSRSATPNTKASGAAKGILQACSSSRKRDTLFASRHNSQ